MQASDEDAGATAEMVARRSYGKLVAILASRNSDLSAAEDALADAFAAALRSWPASGTPENPEAWLLTVARRRQADDARRKSTRQGAEQHLALLADERDMSREDMDHDALPDRRLGLMFACAHPAIDGNVRTPLILQTILGFDAKDIAAAFLVSSAAMSQRLVRAKAKIKHAHISLSIPEAEALPERLDYVLDAVYACFTAGWSDPFSPENGLHDLSCEAIWLGRMLVKLLPDHPATSGLLSLMLFADARRRARRDSEGRFIPLSNQDVELWDAAKIEEGNSLLRAALVSGDLERFQLMAAIQSAHAARRVTGQTDWPAIVLLYDALFSLTQSPVVAVNRAMAIGEEKGWSAGLDALAPAEVDKAVFHYQPYWATKAELLGRAADREGMREAFRMAVALSDDAAIRVYLEQRCQHFLDTIAD